MPAPDRLTIPAPAAAWCAVLTDDDHRPVAAFGPHPTMGAAAGACPGQQVEIVPMAAVPAQPAGRVAPGRRAELARVAAAVRADLARRPPSWGLPATIA
jgi:hypothetical protein